MNNNKKEEILNIVKIYLNNIDVMNERISPRSTLNKAIYKLFTLNKSNQDYFTSSLLQAYNEIANNPFSYFELFQAIEKHHIYCIEQSLKRKFPYAVEDLGIDFCHHLQQFDFYNSTNELLKQDIKSFHKIVNKKELKTEKYNKAYESKLAIKTYYAREKTEQHKRRIENL